MNSAALLFFSPRTLSPLRRSATCSLFIREKSTHSSHDRRNVVHNHPRNVALLASASIGAYCLYKLYTDQHVLADAHHQDPAVEAPPDVGSIRSGLKYYTADEVSRHKSKDTGIWVTYKSGVYDITSFVDGHPGGNIILLAAGGSIEPFWNIYQIHKDENILSMLEELRIGNIEASQTENRSALSSDPWAKEPRRSPLLTVRSERPFNAESPISDLSSKAITPNDVFFVRNHLPVPLVDPSTYSLLIKGIGIPETIILTLDEIKRLPKSSVTMTIQCAGNRRSEMNQVKPVQGLSWSKGAISTATWSGVKLTDLLSHYKVDTRSPSLKHVQFVGLDRDPIKGNQYGASVPSCRVLNEANDVIIAYEMNGEEIPRDHGYPLRVVLPGIVGARQVKWLSEIILSSEESKSHWQTSDYKGFNSSTDSSTADYSKSHAIQDYPVQSAICTPSDNSTVKVSPDGTIEVTGYAWSGGGRGIIRVDVSPDNGVTWYEARLNSPPSDLYSQWQWSQWRAKIPAIGGHRLTIVCKATDSSYNTQPEKFDAVWNFRGFLGNAWNRINVQLTDG